ncbi:MAG: hypothetical protein ABIE94_06660 [archaeon]
MGNKRGQSPALAAIFVLVIMFLIIFYVLFLEPDDRAELLGDPSLGSGGGTGGTGGGTSGGGTTIAAINKVLLSENIGRLDYLKTNSREHDLPSSRISTQTDVQIIKSLSSIYVQNGVMDQEFYNFTFDVDEDLTKDLMLSFNVKRAAGRLIIYLNGRKILNTELDKGSPAPIALQQDYLQDENKITVAVSGVGWAFWRYNEYILDDIKITAKVTDISGSAGVRRFYIDEDEYNNIDEIKLRFYPDCDLNEVGPLTIRLNGVKIFSDIGDCGTYSIYVLGKDSVMPGENILTFSTEKGNYLLDRIKVIIEFEELVYPIYYFEMDDDYFSTVAEDEDAECGKIDGICPDDCDEDEDKDCCFRYDNYWCDLEPRNADDRCVSSVDADDCNRCGPGYEDDSGDPPEACEDMCGDDTDDDCPIGCSMNYDRDCCWEENDENYWCDDVPVDGITSVCEEGIDSSECDDCPSKYRNEDGDRPNCPSTSSDDDENELKSRYDVTLKLIFPNKEDKKADINVNGHLVRVDTNKLDWERNIDDYLRPDTNSIEIVPKSTMDITELEVRIKG